MSDAQLVVMAKYPAAGLVKTRLAARIGAEAACRLYAAFIADLHECLPRAGLPLTWAFWPPEAPFAALVPEQRCIPQRGCDLGARLANAIDACFQRVPAAVITVGVDAPHVTPQRLREAAAALSAGTDLVLGPATDGGYYLIGLRQPCAALFRDIAWGTSSVLEATLARAQAAGLRHQLLPPTFDVDDLDGLHALRGVIAGGEAGLSRTAAALRALAL